MEITQPALSRQMRELEFDVGVSLLERGTRGVELTVAGREFRSDAQAVLGVVDQLPEEIRRAKRGAEERRCVVGVVPHPLVEAMLTRVVVDLESRTPRVRIGTRGLLAAGLPDLMRKSEMDIAIGFVHPARTPLAPNVTIVRLIEDEVSYALLARTHPLAREASLALQDLQEVPLIFPSRESAPPWYDVVMHHFDAAGARPRVHLEYEGVTTIATIVEQGVGWALGFRSYVGHEPSGTALIPLRDFRLPWGIGLLYRKDESRSTILATIDAIISTARQMFPPAVSAPVGTPFTGNASGAVIS
jgi:DNA-binding transcriptional LysR family regulator